MAAGLQSQGQRPTQRPTQRKRNRKRKRRNVSSSSSSSSLSADCASENSENELASTVKISHVAAPRKRVESVKSSSEEEESSSSDSNLESDSPSYPVPALPSTSTDGDPTRPKLHQREDSPPPPLNVPAPNPILGAEKQNEQALKERFQRFWMTSVADAFSDDLNVIRNEPNLTPARLSLLIDSLASGADVYTSSNGQDGKKTNEMEIVLGE